MVDTPVPDWLTWAREIQAIGQTGLTYTENEYEVERYRRLLDIAAEIMTRHTPISQEALSENFQAHLGYATPKVDVRGAVIVDGKLLMVQERNDHRWAMPGGWADVGDRPSETVMREVREESGLEVVPTRVAGVYDANRNRELALYHAYKIVFLCECRGGEVRTSYETLAVDFFPFDALPPLSSFRTNERHLADVLERHRDPALPTAFD